MRNPVRSEADAFRFVWLTIGYFALIVGASALATWAGVAAFVLLTVGAGWWAFRSRPAAPVHVPAASEPAERRVLVVANETVTGPELLAALRERAVDASLRVLVVCPALNSPLRHWSSEEERARDAAAERLAKGLTALRAAGLRADGEVGDGDPLQAVEDALPGFRPDELIVATHPPGRSHWLERGLVERARERFGLPVTHVVVDLGAGQS